MADRDRSVVPGIVLIAVGAYLLLRELGVVYLRWHQVYPVLMLGVAAILFLPVVRARDSGAAFPATFLLVLGVFFVFRNYHLLAFDYYFYDAGDFWPIFLLACGAAFIVQYFLRRDDWGPLIPGGILLFLGSAFLMRTFDLYWFRISNFWPAILIVIGATLIFSSLRGRKP